MSLIVDVIVVVAQLLLVLGACIVGGWVIAAAVWVGLFPILYCIGAADHILYPVRRLTGRLQCRDHGHMWGIHPEYPLTWKRCTRCHMEEHGAHVPNWVDLP